MLKSVAILPERVPDWNTYPFSVPVISYLRDHPLRIDHRVSFFTGENGSGKSTLLEAIAEKYGFGAAGGNRNFAFQSERQQTDVSPLAAALQLGFTVRTGAGFFLRAESFFNLAHAMDELGANRASTRPEALAMGGRGFHEMSHGESFLALLETRVRENGLFLLDEPEAALSPQRQLSLLVLMHDVLRSHASAQFLISTHSPILLGFPGAHIVSFGENGSLQEIEYEDCSAVQITRRFTAHRDSFLQALLRADQE